MTAGIQPAGDRALLIDTSDLNAVLALTDHLSAALSAGELAGVEDLVPAARTVLVRLAADADLDATADALRDLVGVVGAGTARGDGAPSDALVIPVRYDGPDLDDVAELTGLGRDGVIRAHTGTPWRAAFVGFAPGFAYLAGGDPALAVPRRAEPRTSLPAGSVALAGEFSAVYPRESPGGWQLIGTTDLGMWDVTVEPPATIQPGRWVRFVDVADGGSR
ncbi:allophanate hydrolase subunit 1 [Nakamurella flavida]|uniref:Allophanate hydrolase subunit 1 n=1 Tax=Nakamurella flavida TaxID=363630 RepID=A0A938YKV7_9ACTN|nr:allophanate hydrolase subunit 1 [Nakamurella flavida]